MRCLYPRCEHGRVIEQGECSDCLRAENERLKAARLEHSSLCEGSVGLPCDLPSVCDPLRAEVERLTRELTSANQSRDYLEALLAEREERVRRLEKERDALKAALEKVVRNADRPGDMFSVAAAALGEVES